MCHLQWLLSALPEVAKAVFVCVHSHRPLRGVGREQGSVVEKMPYVTEHFAQWQSILNGEMKSSKSICQSWNNTPTYNTCIFPYYHQVAFVVFFGGMWLNGVVWLWPKWSICLLVRGLIKTLIFTTVNAIFRRIARLYKNWFEQWFTAIQCSLKLSSLKLKESTVALRWACLGNLLPILWNHKHYAKCSW